jgi:hypothetical protein
VTASLPYPAWRPPGVAPEVRVVALRTGQGRCRRGCSGGLRVKPRSDPPARGSPWSRRFDPIALEPLMSARVRRRRNGTWWSAGLVAWPSVWAPILYVGGPTAVHDPAGGQTAVTTFTNHQLRGLWRGPEVELLLTVHGLRKRKPMDRGPRGDAAEVPSARGRLLVFCYRSAAVNSPQPACRYVQGPTTGWMARRLAKSGFRSAGGVMLACLRPPGCRRNPLSAAA